MAEDEVPYLSAECPVCDHFGPHFRMPGEELFTCEVCNTSFGTGNAADIHVMLVTSDGDEEGREPGQSQIPPPPSWVQSIHE